MTGGRGRDTLLGRGEQGAKMQQDMREKGSLWGLRNAVLSRPFPYSHNDFFSPAVIVFFFFTVGE